MYISIIQTGFKRKSEDLFESVSLACSKVHVRYDVVIIIVFMQYTNNMLDLLITIGCNIHFM